MRRSSFARCRRWFAERERLFRRLAIGLAVAVFVVQGVRAVGKLEDGDFFLHWKFAGRFVRQELLYAEGLHVPYLPFWAMAWSPIAACSLGVAKALAYPLSLAGLAISLFALDRLTRKRLPLDRTHAFWAAAAALVLISRFLVRELPECGPNLMLLAFTWLAIYLWVEGRDALGGTCLGLAIALKCTPGLFLAYFAWKRQWKMAASATLAAAAFTLAPAVWQGPASYAQHLEIWLAHVRHSAGQNDPSRGVLGEEELKNLSLRPAAARFLMRLPANHLSRVDHPAYLEFLDLPPATADRLVKLLLIALIGGAVWAFRRPVARRDDLTIVYECAAVSALVLLLSPITWAQHCVALLPAFYVLVRSSLSQGRRERWMEAVAAAYVVVNLLLNRGLIGRDLAMLLASYHLPTFSVLGIIVVLVACAAKEGRSAACDRQKCLSYWSAGVAKEGRSAA